MRTIREVMTPRPESVTPDDGVVEVARIMEAHDVGAVPVVESQDTRRPVGIVTDRDLILRVVAPGQDPNRVIPVRDVMTSELVTCTTDEPVAVVADRMKEHQIRRILVVDEDGALVGIVATADLARKTDEGLLGFTVKAISEP